MGGKTLKLKRLATLALIITSILLPCSIGWADNMGGVGADVIEIQEEYSQEQSGWFEQILEKTFGGVFERAFESSSTLVTTWVFQTPLLLNYTWIKTLWWNMYVLSIVLCVIGIAISLFQIVTGKKKTKGILKAFLIALVGCSLSLFITDKTIEIKNNFSNSLIKPVLIEEYHDSNNQKAIIDKGLTNEEISFKAFEGKNILKLAFGGDLNDEKKMYKTFTEGDEAGGLLVMIWGMGILWLIGIMGILIYGLLGILGGGSSFWFMLCAYTGDIKPAIGYFNLLIRTLLISVIMNIAWLFSVYINKSNEFENVGRQLIACILFTLALVIAVVVWLVWVQKAIKDPVNLAGGIVQDKYGEMLDGSGRVLSHLGSSFGIKYLSEKGEELQLVGRERKKIGKEMVAGNYKDLNKDRLDGVREMYRQQKYTNLIKENVIKDFNIGDIDEDVKYNSLGAIGLDNFDIKEVLNQNGLEGSYFTLRSGEIYLKEGTHKQVNSKIQAAFEQKNLIRHRSGNDKGYILGTTRDETSKIKNILNKKKADYKLINAGKEDEKIFIREDSKQEVLDAAILSGKSMDKKSEKKYVGLNISNNEAFHELHKVIRRKYPNAILEHSEMDVKNNKLVIDNTYINDVSKEITEYQRKIPYWDDKLGYYYYFDKKLGQVVKQFKTPDNGRYMGAYSK